MKFLTVVVSYLCTFSGLAQLPETEIFLADISVKNNLVKIEKAWNITNHKGYDNQPFFLPDKRTILFSSAMDADKKVHTCSYDVKTKKTKQITFTKTSEYSPMINPDGKTISSVVVEEDSTQRIWLYDLKTGEKKTCLHEATDSVGYYARIGQDTILYYKLTMPHSLHVLDLKTGEDNWLCNYPARSFKSVTKTSFFYVIQEEKENKVMLFDINSKKALLYATDKKENQDYAWHAGLGILKSELNKLYRYSPETRVWVEAADFSAYGITKITRFVFSPDNKHIAIVSNAN